MNKKRTTISIDPTQYKLHDLANKNISKYINELLQKEFFQTNKEALYEQIRDKLVRDPVLLHKILEISGNQPEVRTTYYPPEQSA